MRWSCWLGELLFPEKCVLCGALLERGHQDLCKTCRIEAPWHPNHKYKPQFLDSFTAVWYYEGYVRKSLLRFKFYNARGNARSYGRLLAMKLLTAYPEGFDLLTWVPVSSLRKLRRGYDQVEQLAKAVGEELGMKPVSLLRKIRHNPAQSGISDPAARKANVQGVYRVKDPGAVAGKRILLLDDILTTGATAGEAGRTLLGAGAKEVHCAVIAAARKESHHYVSVFQRPGR